MIRRLRSRFARPQTREAELAAIAAFIAHHGVRRVSIDPKGIVHLRQVWLN